MCTVLAISGTTKVPVFTKLTHQEAATIRHDLVRLEDNFDMLGNQICKFRIRKDKKI